MRATALKLSLFTAFTIVVTFYLAAVIGRLTPFETTYAIEGAFSDATGLLKGDPVTVAGVLVGKVTGLEVEGSDAVVTMEINGDVELPKTTIADINYRNLLGQRVINLLEPEAPSEDLLEEGDRIPIDQTRPALDLSVLFNNLRPLIQTTNPEDVNLVARAVVKIFKGREDAFGQLLGNVGGITHTLADRDQRLARLVSDLDEVTNVLNSQSGNLRTSLERFTEFMQALAKTTPTIERVVDQVNDASNRFGGLVARNRQNLDQELQDLATVLGVVNENLGPLARVSRNLKEVILATARSQSYGKWWNLYVVSYCQETGTGKCTGLLGD